MSRGSDNRPMQLVKPSLPQGRGVNVPPEFEDALVWVAWLYYADQLTQSEIAQVLKVSRATIVKMLQDARERVDAVGEERARAFVPDDAGGRATELRHLEDRAVARGLVAVVAPVADRIERSRESERTGGPAPPRTVRRPGAPGEGEHRRERQRCRGMPRPGPRGDRPGERDPSAAEDERGRDREPRMRGRVLPQRRFRGEVQGRDHRGGDHRVLGCGEQWRVDDDSRVRCAAGRFATRRDSARSKHRPARARLFWGRVRRDAIAFPAGPTRRCHRPGCRDGAMTTMAR